VKISQAQKVKNKKHIIETAVNVFNRVGYKTTTIKQIAKESKISEPSIYNYFPNKESLVFGYFELELLRTIDKLNTQPSFINLNFCEKIQSFMETQLEALEKNRTLVEESFKFIFVTSSIHSSIEVTQQKKILTTFMREYMIKSQKIGDFPTSPLDEFFIGLIWDFYVGIVCYWLKDSSPSYANTSQLIDKSILLLQEILKTNIANKLLDILQFFVRNHLFNGLSSLNV